MAELRTKQGVLAGKYGFTARGFVFEYKHRKGMVRVFLPLFPMIGHPIVTIE